MARSVRVVGLGGSLRAASTSRTALQATLEGAAANGAGVPWSVGSVTTYTKYGPSNPAGTTTSMLAS